MLLDEHWLKICSRVNKSSPWVWHIEPLDRAQYENMRDLGITETRVRLEDGVQVVEVRDRLAWHRAKEAMLRGRHQVADPVVVVPAVVARPALRYGGSARVVRLPRARAVGGPTVVPYMFEAAAW